MLNKIILMGRLVKDPELRRTQSGTAVTSFRIAVDRDFKSQDGSKQADFFDVVAVSKEKILLNTGHVYDGIVAEYPFLAGPHRSPKPAFYSKLMSAAGFTGYLCPLFGESTLNVDCPAVFLPATIAHEFSHQAGCPNLLPAIF